MENNENNNPEELEGKETSENANSSNTEGGVDESNSVNSTDEGGEKQKSFSQDEVSRMMAREKKQGRNSVFNELGINPNDKRMIKLVKSLTAKDSSDVSDEQDEGSEKIAELEQRAMMAEAKAEAMMLGVKPQFVDDVVTLAYAKISESEEEKDFKTVIGELKSKYSLWFGKSDEDEENKGQKGTGSSVNPGSSSNGSKEESIGKRLAAQRKPKGKNFSYWGK